MTDLKKNNGHRTLYGLIAVFLIVNFIAAILIGMKESSYIDRCISEQAEETGSKFNEVMDNYRHSFQLFVEMMRNEIKNNPDPEHIWNFLKNADSTMLRIEGDTFDGLYMYYQGRYLYSWDTPYSQYEETGYIATERPWYKDAVKGGGDIVFTPPYMSYANHYILTTLSQLQPDGETVFAYDIKMGDIQQLVSSLDSYENAQTFIYDKNGTVIGSTNADYLGGCFHDSVKAAEQAVDDAKAELEAAGIDDKEQVSKLKDQLWSAEAFYKFRQSLGTQLKKIQDNGTKAVRIKLNDTHYYSILKEQDDFCFLVLVPVSDMLKATLGTWLVPLLLIELLLIYMLGRVTKGIKNRELRNAYIELGQTQKRLEIALNAAQKAAAVDDLTGMLNFKSFRTKLMKALDSMEEGESGILIMIDGDHFKRVNDNYGHSTGDEVIKLTAQMIIGRIRVVDLASRLHGDEFAIFVSNTSDYTVAQGIMEDINQTLTNESQKRGMPSITLSAGAVIARHGDTYTALAKAADEALYKAKETHNGAFSY